MKAQPPAPQNSSRFLRLGVVVFLLFAGSYAARSYFSPSGKKDSSVKPHQVDYKRIVGLAPSIVEVVYQLDIDNKLVGISRFCEHLPEAIEKPVVGGFLDLNFEALIRLQPDCVILLEEQQSVANKLNALDIDTIIIDHASTAGIIDSIRVIGSALGSQAKAQSVLNDIDRRIQEIKTSHPTQKPSVLVCIGRDTNEEHPGRVTAAGNKGVHQEYIIMAGGTNVYQGSVAYPILSREKLIHLNPDIIIDLVSEKAWQEKGEPALLKQWQSYGELKAVQTQNIVFLYENKHMIPGPRFVDTLEVFSKTIQNYGKQ